MTNIHERVTLLCRHVRDDRGIFRVLGNCLGYLVMSPRAVRIAEIQGLPPGKCCDLCRGPSEWLADARGDTVGQQIHDLRQMELDLLQQAPGAQLTVQEAKAVR